MRTNELTMLPFEYRVQLKMPLFVCPVSAGFPSPADDFVETGLDLNEHLIQHPAATFFYFVQSFRFCHSFFKIR